MTGEGSVRSESSAPVLLLVGAASSLKAGLVEALTRHGVLVETVRVDSAQKTVVVTAPDIVVLADEAVEDGGSRVMNELGRSPLTSFVPVAMLCEEPSLEQRLEAFRLGVAAIVPRLPSMDGMAEKLAQLVREIPERSSQNFGELGESTLRDFTEALSHQLRARVLAQASSGSEKEIRLVFGGGRPLARLLDEFVQQVEHHVVHAEALAGDALTQPTQGLLSETELMPAGLSLTGMRVALADDDAARADAVAQDLRTRGATVLVTDLDPNELRFGRLRRLDPNVFIVGEQQLKGAGYALVRRAHSDSRLRWATLLVVDWEQLCPEPGQPFALDQLAARLIAIVGVEQEIHRRVLEGNAFDVRLENTGPARLLYALADAARPLRVTVQTPRARVELDVSDHLIVGATMSRSGGESLEGPAALAALLTFSTGRVTVTPVTQPAAANVMAAVDLALDLADKELEAGRVRPFSARPEPSVPSVEPAVSTASVDARAPVDGEAQHQLVVARSESTRFEASPVEPNPEPVVSAEPVAVSTQAALDASPRPAGWSRGRALLGRWLRLAHERKMDAVLVAVVGLLVVALVVLLVSGRGADDGAASAPSAPASPVRPGAAAASIPAASASSVESRSAAPGIGGGAGQDAEQEEDTLLLALPPANNPRAPSCDELLKEQAPMGGPAAAAAYEAMVRGRRALVRGDVDEAQRAYCYSVRTDPGNATAQVELARLLLVRRDGNAGLRQVEVALALDSGSRVVKGLLGDALARLGRYDGARRAWFEEAQLTAQSERSRRALLTTLMRAARRHRGRHAWGEAERFFRRVVVLEPSNIEASLGIAQALFSFGVKDEAVAWAQYVKRLSPHHPVAAELLRKSRLVPETR